MEHWQFLIQKQGDRSWHTLESPNTDIIEGKYRVLARSQRPNTDVEVRVTHSLTQELPPRRRIQKRSRRTNAEGLMAVLPFTYFKPGVWELQCSGDLMSDILGKSWQYSVRLQVLPQSINRVITRLDAGEVEESSDYLDANVTVKLAIPLEPTINITAESVSYHDTDLPAETLDDPVLDQPVSPVWLKGETAEQILQNLLDLALPVSEPLLEDKTVTDNSVEPTSPPLLLTLDQGTYVASWGENLTINGKVELKETAHGVDEIQHLYALELGMELRSPLGGEILSQARQPLANQTLPFTITYAIDIPNCESKLILADIGLCGALTDGDQVILLASQSFTITADVTELLAISTALQSSTANLDEITVPATKEAEPSAMKLDLSLVNLVKSIKQDQSLVLSSSTSKSLPPQIDSQPAKRSTSSRGLQLPNLPPLPTSAIAVDENLAAESANRAIAGSMLTDAPTSEAILEQDEPITPINLEQLVIRKRPAPIINSTFPFLKRLPDAPDHQKEVNSHVSEALDLTISLDDNLHPPLENVSPSPEEEVTTGQYPMSQAAEGEISTTHALTTFSDDQGTEFPTAFDASVLELPTLPNSESIEPSFVTETANSKLVIEGNPNSSPLIRKWLQSQGYTLPEPVQLPEQPDHTYPRQTKSRNQVPLPPPPPPPIVENVEQLEENTEEQTPKATTIPTESPPANGVQQVSKLHRPIPPLPPPHRPKPQPAWLLQEIVVDDTDIETEADIKDSNTLEIEEQPQADIAAPETTSAVNYEPLPIPQLHVPEGELIAGKSVTIRLELPESRPQVAIKLWVEDYQMRWLLDGPHLLKNLLPTSTGGWEVITQLTIPFGCLEIRIEAIALDLVSQQESHKATTLRSVVPPDLPALQLDELLGI
jgi:hypothetical protein